MTAVKSLTMEQLDESKIRYPEIAKNGKIGKATHVVTQIQYGAEATFTFTKRFESDDEEEKASGELKINVGKLLKLLKVDAEVGGSVGEKNNDSASNIDCQFEGDFKLPDNVKGPTTFEEALEFAKIFVKVSSDSLAKDIADGNPLGVPCTVWLFPLALMQDAEGAPAIRYEVSLAIASECVKLIEEYDNLEAKLNLMLNDSAIKQISPLYKKLRLFHHYLTSFRGELKTNLGKLIIDIRSGKVDVGHFRHLLDHITGKKFPLNPNGISDCWLDQKYKEFRIINRFKEQARQEISCQNRDNVTFFPTERTLQNTMTSYSVDFGIELTFPWLGRAEPFLEIVRNQTLNSEIITEDDPKITDIGIDKVWYEDNRLVKRIQKEINVFAKLANEKSHDKKFAFVLTTPDDENATYASESSIILVHHQLTRNSGWNGLQLICQYYPRDNLNDVVLLLLDDTDIDKYWHKFNCLFILCRFYQKENLLEFVQVFLDRKIDINCKDDDGWTPLLILCRYYDKDNLIDIVRLFLNEKFDLEINWRNNDRFNALHILCRHYTKKNLVDMIKLFIQRKIDINCKTNIGWNALHFVCRFQPKNSLPELVRLLIQNKVDKEAITTGGEFGTASSFLLGRFRKEEVLDVVNILN
jgi:ankyrin repeat protein